MESSTKYALGRENTLKKSVGNTRDAVGLLACIESNENSVFDVADQLGPTEVFPFTKDDTSAISDL